MLVNIILKSFVKKNTTLFEKKSETILFVE